MLDIQIRPIVTWPGKENTDPRWSQFKKNYRDNLKDLEFELTKADAVAQMNFMLKPNENDIDLSSCCQVARELQMTLDNTVVLVDQMKIRINQLERLNQVLSEYLDKLEKRS